MRAASVSTSLLLFLVACGGPRAKGDDAGNAVRRRGWRRWRRYRGWRRRGWRIPCLWQLRAGCLHHSGVRGAGHLPDSEWPDRDPSPGHERRRRAGLRDGDGALDAIVTNGFYNTRSEQSVSVLLGNGDGTFRPRQQFVAGPNPRAVDVADLNGDARLDLVVGVSGSHVLSVFTNTCTPQLALRRV